ncbi:hypothetical protein ACFWTC_36805 [Streptomyces sp. NPDC058619]|uniref:hypothetical protein n=1 Tax=unclassified Streptomyces TaxID=2593676 RepID=UPI0036605513
MAVAIAMLSGVAAALAATLLALHFGATPLQSLCSAGASFVAATTLVTALLEKLGVL